MYSQSIGIIGGFGGYATLGFFESILDAFASDCERNYPHIYMDNDFTMPSRTKALLYGDDYEEVVRMIAASMRGMNQLGADYIVMACGTAHAFLPDVYKVVPDVKEKVLNIIEILRDELQSECISRTLVIAAEGTLKKEIYPQYLQPLECISPTEKDYSEIRYFIEGVKRNVINEEMCRRFIAFLKQFDCENVILGCTEFPVLVDTIKKSAYGMGKQIDRYSFWDPLDATIRRLKKILK